MEDEKYDMKNGKSCAQGVEGERKTTKTKVGSWFLFCVIGVICGY